MFKPFYVLLALLPLAATLQEPAPIPALVIPPEAAALVNPTKSTPQGLAMARKMYGYDCAMCHGANGNGKGELVDSMKLTLKDYTDRASLQSRTDGELFYIIQKGSGPMTGEGDRQKPAEIWNMVTLVRSFAKN